MAKVKDAEVIVYATPIYYYEMCGQMKTLLDRLNPLYSTDYSFRDIYMIATRPISGPASASRIISAIIPVSFQNGWMIRE